MFTISRQASKPVHDIQTSGLFDTVSNERGSASNTLAKHPCLELDRYFEVLTLGNEREKTDLRITIGHIGG